MFKVAQYYDGYYRGSGGIETHITEICKYLNYDLEVLSDSVSDYLEYTMLPANVHLKRFGPTNHALDTSESIFSKKLFYPYRLVSDIVRIRNKNNYLVENHFDLVHFHGNGIGEALLKLSYILKSPSIVEKYFDYSWLSSKIVTVHGLSSLLTDNVQIKQLEVNFLNQFDNIIYVDLGLHSFLSSELKDDINLNYMPNSIDTDLFKYDNLSIGGKLKVGFVGRLEKSRGISLLIDLINNMPPFIELHVIGAGSFRDLQKFKSKINTSNIFFYENIGYDEMPQIFNKFQVLLNPVLVEGISRVTLEAMSCGRVVIMLDYGNRYPVINAKTGFLIKNNLKDLIETLKYLYDNPKEIQKISLQSRQIVETEFSSKIIVPQIELLYSKVICESSI